MKEDKTPSETVNSMQESDYPTKESWRKFIRERFKIDENEILNSDEKLKEEVIKLFMENFSALALHPNHKTDILELKIELEPGAEPKRSKVRLLNPDESKPERTVRFSWIQQGIIEPLNSPWAWPLVLVKNKDGRSRWVTDQRLLNDITIKDAYPLTKIQENLKGAKIFTSIDACTWRLPLHSDQGKEPRLHHIYQPFWNILLYLDAFCFVKCRQRL